MLEVLSAADVEARTLTARERMVRGNDQLAFEVTEREKESNQ